MNLSYPNDNELIAHRRNRERRKFVTPCTTYFNNACRRPERRVSIGASAYENVHSTSAGVRDFSIRALRPRQRSPGYDRE